MAKKKEKQKAKPKTDSVIEKETESAVSDTAKSALPQNILQMGEHAEEDKKIYISQAIYKDIRRFTKNKTQIESGGILVGDTIEEFGKTNIMVRGFIEAKYSEGTPTTLKFTHETWEYVHSQMDKRFRGMRIVGWIHTHPSFGIFLSEYDMFIQDNFFNDKNQIAYVVDPIQNTEGFFFWKNEEIERCKGFYIYDDVDVEINIPQEDKGYQAAQQAVTSPHSSGNDWRLWLLYAAVIVLAILNIFLFSQIKFLKTQQESLKNNLAFLLSRQSFTLYQPPSENDTTSDAAQSFTLESPPDVPSAVSDAGATTQAVKTEPSSSAQNEPAEGADHE